MFIPSLPLFYGPGSAGKLGFSRGDMGSEFAKKVLATDG
jgi:hypothetical protein